MTLAELNAVAAVAEHASFRAAARQLAVSPSALSHTIAAIERRLGVRLFHRTTRSVAVTEAGARFLERVRPALREIEGAIALAGDERATPAGTLRLNTSMGAARLVLMPLLCEYARRYPDVHVDLVTDERLVDIVERGFDAGVRQRDLVPRDMVAVPCSGDVRFAVVGAPAYLERHGAPRTPADLRDHRCVRPRFTGGATYTWDFEKRGAKVSLDVSGPFTLDGYDLMLEAALAGLGLAYVSEWSAAPHLAAGTLVRVLADWTPGYPGLALYYAANRHVPAPLRALVELVRETVKPARREGPSPSSRKAPSARKGPRGRD